MLRRMLLFPVVVCLLVLPAAIAVAGETLQNENARKLVDLVDEAARKLSQEGESALSEFNKPGTKWSHGETYIIVVDMAGNVLAHAEPGQVGKNILNLRDVNGKPIFFCMLQRVYGEDNSGWIHYMWPKPGSIFPTWKSVFVRRVLTPSNKEFVVSCGLYNMKMEKAFVAEVVNDAAYYINTIGEAAFVRFRTKADNFYYLQGNYVFVIDDKGVFLVNPAFSNLEGGNYYDYRDEKGKYVFRDMIAIVKQEGSGWLEYMWARPGQAQSLLKSTFVKGADLNGRPVIVGSGYYND